MSTREMGFKSPLKGSVPTYSGRVCPCQQTRSLKLFDRGDYDEALKHYELRRRGEIGFADFIPKELPLPQKALFITPLLLWLISLYCALQVMMTRQLNILLHSPDDIREKSDKSCGKNKRI